MDQIHIRDLRVRCIVGTKPEERTRRQSVIINIALGCDLRLAGRSDRLDDTVNYKRLTDCITATVAASRHQLIERMAAEIAALCLRESRVREVTVVVDKPGALRVARSAAVEIRRKRRSKRHGGG